MWELELQHKIGITYWSLNYSESEVQHSWCDFTFKDARTLASQYLAANRYQEPLLARPTSNIQYHRMPTRGLLNLLKVPAVRLPAISIIEHYKDQYRVRDIQGE